MSVTLLRPGRPRRPRPRTVGRVALPPRTSQDLKKYAEARQISLAEAGALIVTNYFVLERGERDSDGDRAAVLRQPEAIDERDSA